MDEADRKVLAEGEDKNPQSRCNWYALYTKPHKEYLVQEVLLNCGVETYLPQIAVVVRRRDRRSMKPFLPQYLFAYFDPNAQRFADVCWTPGLRCIVSAGGRPVVVPDEVVMYLRRRLEHMATTDVPDAPFKKGEVIRIAHGPLEGLEAIFDQQITPKGRVLVFLNVMSRLVKAELDLEDLI
ncbi:MAG: transcription termination/antitermination NusG family protein [Anaerolineae bacterium]